MAEGRTNRLTVPDRPALYGLAGCCLFIFAVLFAGPALRGAEANHATPKPAIVIPVEPLGYGPPGELYLTMRYSQVSLDFVDAAHLLFTFQKKGLLRHTADELPDDDDQLIHAVVLELPEGKQTASADWRMHDRQRYLWPLGAEAFLVRERDSLFVTDSSLALRPYGGFSGHLVGVQVSPGGELLVAETEEPDKQEITPDKQAGNTPGKVGTPSRPANGKPFLLQVFRFKDRVLIARSRVRRPTNLAMNSNGFVESLEGKPNQWTLSLTPLTEGASAASAPFAELSSACQPILTFISADTILAIRCTPSYEHLAAGLTLDGKMLWEHKWQSKRVWPMMEHSRDGSRFAEGILTGPGGAADPRTLGSNDISGQRVDVFNTASGKLLLSVPASPVYDAGQNFALSADGRRFVILHGGALEIYDLPADGK